MDKRETNQEDFGNTGKILEMERLGKREPGKQVVRCYQV